MSERTVEGLIGDLTEDLAPVKALAHPVLRAGSWILGAAAYVAVVVVFLGVRPDLVAQTSNVFFLFEISVMALVFLTAALASCWLCVPDMRGRVWLASVPVSLVLAFTVWTFLRAITEGVVIQNPHWSHCFQDAVLMGAVPAAAIMLLSRKGATTKPFLMGVMNVLSVTALGYIGLRLTCANDTVGHVCFYHLFPFVVFGVVVGASVRRLYRW